MVELDTKSQEGAVFSKIPCQTVPTYRKVMLEFALLLIQSSRIHRNLAFLENPNIIITLF